MGLYGTSEGTCCNHLQDKSEWVSIPEQINLQLTAYTQSLRLVTVQPVGS